MPWEDTEEYIRSGHRDVEEFQQDTLKTITLDEKEGIKAVVGKPKGKHTIEVVSYLFEKDKGWTVEKAKEWFRQHHNPAKEHVYAVLPFTVTEKIMEKPLRIRGLAMTAGMSRNFNIYTPEELQAFASRLVDAPLYLEHVTAANAVGKVTKTEWDGQGLRYEAEVYDEETASKIRKGLIRHVSVGADYETIDIIDGKIPHGLRNAEMSLVAVPGIPETNIQVMEKLHTAEQAFEPMMAGEYILGFYQDAQAFLPEHFSTVWLDRENGVLAIMGKPRQQPEVQRTLAVFFAKEKMWDQVKIQDWLALHPTYMASASSGSVSRSLLKKPTEPVIPVGEAVSLIEKVLPSPIVQRSWSLGPQRMCQELRRVLVKLHSLQDGHEVDRE
ncbi:hypothetical protein G4O51_04940 [Candidatus Bathyarchaeota archaeon A05DMB-2]|jgi:hypothetical protein|nr:hypothetical protein [Candidatus Bathyarchaeota archaeon A05DMB-2]